MKGEALRQFASQEDGGAACKPGGRTGSGARSCRAVVIGSEAIR
jgi:hypothetical protein